MNHRHPTETDPTEQPEQPDLTDLSDPLTLALQAWVAPALADDGFAAAVMRRLPAQPARDPLGAAAALRRLAHRQGQARRRQRSLQWGAGLGLVLGLAVVVATAAAGGPLQGLALAGPAGLMSGVLPGVVAGLLACLGSVVLAAAVLASTDPA